jgi:GH24 family phage-related lysozyme (muramidase)
MHKSVLDIFPIFTASFEGRISWMYQDIKGLVTIGLGCLIDPMMLATGLPFVRIADNSKAEQKEIISEWTRIKSNKNLANQGHLAAKQFCRLRLSEKSIDNLARTRLLDDEKLLNSRFPKLQEWPADCQLALFSMAWAMGPFFFRGFPKFVTACINEDWKTAAKECLMRTTNNPGLISRNRANVKLFLSASTFPIHFIRGYQLA